MPARSSPRRLSLSGSHWRADGRPKVRFATKDQANVAAGERAAESGTVLGVYPCDFCGGWHMGRPSGRVRE